MRIGAGGLAGASALLLVSACQDPTQITLEITTDVACDDGLETSITVGELGTIETKPAAATTGQCDPATGRIGSLVALPSGEGSAEVAFRVLTRIGNPPPDCSEATFGNDCIVSRRVLGYLEHKKLLVPVVQRDACRGELCDVDTTCVRGDCVPARIDPETCIGERGCGETILGGGAGGGGGAGAGGGPTDPDTLVHGWSDNLGSPNSETGCAIALTQLGHVNVAAYGGFADLGNGPVSTTAASYFLASFDDEPALRWSAPFRASVASLFMGLAVDADENSYVVGKLQGTTEFGQNKTTGTANADQVFVASYDAAGIHRWSYLYGSTMGLANEAYAVAVDAQNRVYITGAIEEPLDFGGGTRCNTGRCMFVLALETELGDFRWAETFGTDATGLDIAVDAQDNVYVTGVATQTVDFGNGAKPAAGNPDILLASFDSAGNLRWDARFGDALSNYGASVVVDDDGNVALGGHTSGVVDFGGGALDFGMNPSVFLASFDSEGTYQWASDSLVNGATEQLADLDVSPAGNLYLVFSSQNQGANSFVVASFDAAGGPRWSMPFPMTMSQFDRARGIAVSDVGEVWVTGGFTNTIDLGGGPLTAISSDDIFLLRLIASP